MKLNFNLTNRVNGYTLKAILVSAFVAGGTIAQAQTTYTWDGSAGDNSWSNATNWSPDRITPAATDIMVIGGTRTINIDFASASESIDRIDISANANVTFVVADNKTIALGTNTGPNLFVRANGKLTFTNSVAGAALKLTIPSPNTKFARVDGTLEFNAALGTAAHQLMGGASNSVRFVDGSTFIAGTGFTGYAFGNTVATSAQFRSGSKYISKAGSAPFGSSFTTAVTSFDEGSLYLHQSPEPLELGGRNYADLTVDYPGYTATTIGSTTSVFSVDNFTVSQASSITIPNNANIRIDGNLAVNSGTLSIDPNPAGGSATVVTSFNPGGTGLVQSISTSNGGQIVIGALSRMTVGVGQHVQLNTSIKVVGQVLVSGTLDMQGFTLYSDAPNTGTFTLAADAVFHTKHPEGIYKTGPLGCILVNKNRGFNNAYYRYYGDAAQQTGTGLPTTIKKLTVDNPMGVVLTSAVVIQEELALTEGILYTAVSRIPTVDYTGTITGQGSLNYVNGPLSRRLASFTPVILEFPIGRGDYRPVQLDMQQDAADEAYVTYTAELIDDAPDYSVLNLPASLKQLSETRYYTINKSTAMDLIYGKVSLVFTHDEGFGVLHPEAVKVAKTIGTTGNWEDLGGTMNASNTVITSGIFKSFSSFSLGRTSATLPVSLISLDATPKRETVLVNWSTAKEENNDYFEVQRSADGHNFHTIGTVEGMGNASNINHYAFTDAQPLAGLAYYRLRQVDFDGKAAFHGPVAVRMATANIAQLALYPNPAVNAATLTFEAETDETATLRIVNTVGQTVAQLPVAAVKGYNSVSIPAAELATGMYIVEMITGTGTTATRLIKQ